MQNKILRYLSIFLLITIPVSIQAMEMGTVSFHQADQLVFETDNHLSQNQFQVLILKPKFRKLKAVLLAIFLGHFGVHRIYLGTAPNVPVVYSLTLGGGLGILPLLDIIAILSTQDLENYTNNDQVFMWARKKGDS